MPPRYETALKVNSSLLTDTLNKEVEGTTDDLVVGVAQRDVASVAWGSDHFVSIDAILSECAVSLRNHTHSPNGTTSARHGLPVCRS